MQRTWKQYQEVNYEIILKKQRVYTDRYIYNIQMKILKYVSTINTNMYIQIYLHTRICMNYTIIH